MMLESCSWLAKKELSKTDGIGPRYKQPCGVGVHVDISTHRQEGVKMKTLMLNRHQPTKVDVKLVH